MEDKKTRLFSKNTKTEERKDQRIKGTKEQRIRGWKTRRGDHKIIQKEH